MSPTTIKTENGIEFEGAIIALIHNLISKPNKTYALVNSFTRQSAPNINNLLATIFVFCLMIYFQGFKTELKLRSQAVRGLQKSFPIKLFYLSNTPIILQTMCVNHLNIISQTFYRKFKGFWFAKILGVWKENPENPFTGGKCIGGLAYYITPPSSFNDVLINPLHFILYMSFVIISSALFSYIWIGFSGRSPRDLLKEMETNHLYFDHKRKESRISLLKKHIPVAAMLGGIFIAVLSTLSDLFGALGSGTGILLVVNIIYGYLEMFEGEGGKGNKGRRSALAF